MTYFKIGNTDFSDYVSSLRVTSAANYNSQTNAAGNMVVDYINTKREIEVGIIPLNDTVMSQLLNALTFNVQISFRNPKTNQLETNVNCILPENEIEYYTIRSNNVSYKEFELTFIEM